MGSNGGLSCGASFCKYLMFGFNLIFWIAGAAILGVAIWLKVDPTALGRLEIIAGNDKTFWDVALYTLIGIGAFIFLVGFLGCCGAISESPCMLITYGILVGLILVAQITAAILALVFRNRIDGFMLEGMRNQIRDHYRSDNSTHTVTEAWNKMQVEWKCCGAQGHLDWRNSTYWRTYHNAVPYTCCKMIDPDNVNMQRPWESAISAVRCQQQAATPNGGQDLNSNGCYEEAHSWMRRNIGIILGVAFGLAGLQLLGLIGACCLQSSIRSKNENVVM